jgi:hypothetical protein
MPTAAHQRTGELKLVPKCKNAQAIDAEPMTPINPA